jgi:ribosomal protein S18 acetylase RimI-like enzyme
MDSHGAIEAVALAVINPGKTAMFFVSPARTDAESCRASALIDTVSGGLTSAGVHLAQTLLDVHDRDEEDVFARAGFHRLATLSYLERPLRARVAPTAPQWPGDITLQGYQPSLHGLRGCRETSDILDGHRAAGAFDASLWTLLLIDDRPSGALLLNPAVDGSGIELVYLGLAPWARGRKLGQRLLRHGLLQATRRPERVMTLAVDEANAPALALFQREHFRPVLRRVAMIRSLRV